MYRFFLFQFFVLISFCVAAQHVVEPKKMTYLATPKPHSIFYNDSFYNGSKAFRQLFFRTKDPQIIQLYKKHQFDKVAGSALGVIGVISLTAGSIYASGNHPNISRGVGWGLVGTGLVAAISGGYLVTQSVNDLLVAVYLFNKRVGNQKAAVGVSGSGLSFVLNF